MPVSSAIAESNRTQTERLRRIARRLDAAMLAVRMPNGWSVAGTLAHLALWDRFRLSLMRRWAAGQPGSSIIDANVFNDAVQPLLEMIPHESVAVVAVAAAEEIDALLLDLSDEVIEAALARPDAVNLNLNRGSHRKHHLDRIEQALAGAGYA